MHPFAAFTSYAVVRLFFACPASSHRDALLPSCSHGRKKGREPSTFSWFGVALEGRREARHCSAGGEAEEQGLEDLRGKVSVQQRAVRIPTQVRLHAEEAAQIVLTTAIEAAATSQM